MLARTLSCPAKLRARDPDGELNLKYGAAYVADGWDSCDSLPLINSAFINANDGGMYWRARGGVT